MCLTTQNRRAFIAKKDLKTYKVLRYYIDDSNERVYSTLCKNYPVKLSSVMRPEPLGKDEYPFKEKGIYYEIGKGFIHSFIGQISSFEIPLLDNIVAIKVYIPKGTEYYIDNEMTDVCSKELRLTSNIIHIDKDKFTLQERRDIVEPLLDNFVSKDKVCAGYMVKYDKTFIHPLDYGEVWRMTLSALLQKLPMTMFMLFHFTLTVANTPMSLVIRVS